MSELKTGVLLQGGKYRIEKSLGQGGFGITYLAEQTNLGRKVCIKEFFMKEYGERTAAPEEDTQETVLTGGGHPTGQSPNDIDATILTGVSAVTSAAAAIMGRYREKFVKEARTIARLDHPGIVRIHDVFEENGTAYYVMDFIEGENLNDLVKREGALPEERALGYIRQVADALSYVHGHNIMHLDVKPANIIVRKSDDKAILIDFGTAKQYDSEGSQTSTTPVGLSVGYAPIEMTKPGGVQTFSPETDVYSLGATLYYLVTGQNPPDASERMEMIMEGEKFQFSDGISSSTAEVIEQSMQARKKRVQTVSGFMELLNSDGEKKRIEAEEKAAREAEAKRQEALRKEREKEEAEKKRIAEEKAREEAEAKRQEALRKEQERAEAEKKRVAGKEAQNNKTIKWVLIGFAAIIGAVILIPNINNSSYSNSSYSGDGPAEMSAADLLGGSSSSNSSSTDLKAVLPNPVMAQSIPSKNKEAQGEIKDEFSLKHISRLTEPDETLLSESISYSSTGTPFPSSYNGCSFSSSKQFNGYSIAYYHKYLMLADSNRVLSIVSLERQELLQDGITLLGAVGNLIIVSTPVDANLLDTPLLLIAIDFTNGDVKWTRKINHQPTHPNYIYENTLFVTQNWSDLNDDGYTFTYHAIILFIDLNTGKTRKSINIPNSPEVVFSSNFGISGTSIFVECGKLGDVDFKNNYFRKFSIVH